MRIALLVLVSVSIALAASGCNEEARLTVLFTGDERNFVTPVG
jgi:hypothetical protein